MLCFFQGLGFQVPGRDVNGLVTGCFSEVGYERTIFVAKGKVN